MKVNAAILIVEWQRFCMGRSFLPSAFVVGKELCQCVLAIVNVRQVISPVPKGRRQVII